MEKCIKKASIFTDFRSAVEANTIFDRDLNYLILILKNKLRSVDVQNIDILFIWIPLHVGILGNETADLLAGNAVHQDEIIDYFLQH